MGRLDGKVAAIFGATSGIGRRTAEVFVAEGAAVVLSGRRAALGEALAAELGGRAVFAPADVADEAQVAATIAMARDRFGRLDCVFNNAGIPGARGGVEALTPERVNAEMAVLVNGVLWGMKHAAPIMRAQGSGSIINTGSIAGQRAGYGVSLVYSAAKAAVIHATRCVAMELAPHKVRANSISPGAIATGIFGKAFGLEDSRAEDSVAALEARFGQAQPLPRAGLPDDIAKAALYLAGDDSRFVTATDILVDGGMIAGRSQAETDARWEALSAFVNPGG